VHLTSRIVTLFSEILQIFTEFHKFNGISPIFFDNPTKINPLSDSKMPKFGISPVIQTAKNGFLLTETVFTYKILVSGTNIYNDLWFFNFGEKPSE